MRRGAIYLTACLSVAVILFAGCGTTAVIADFSDGEFEVHHVKTEPLKKRVKIISGESTRVIRLKDVKKLSVFPAGSKNKSGQLYYQVGILMKNGDKIGYATSADEKWTDSYMCLEGTLKGKVDGEEFSIPLDKIMEFKIINR